MCGIAYEADVLPATSFEGNSQWVDFVDFVCLKARLAIEIDGAGHQEESDQRKTAYLEANGFRVIRIPASWTDEHLGDVIDTILFELESLIPPANGAADFTSPLAGEVGGEAAGWG